MHGNGNTLCNFDFSQLSGVSRLRELFVSCAMCALAQHYRARYAFGAGGELGGVAPATARVGIEYGRRGDGAQLRWRFCDPSMHLPQPQQFDMPPDRTRFTYGQSDHKAIDEEQCHRGVRVRYAHTSASERRTLPPAIAVSTVAFAVDLPRDAPMGDPDARATDAEAALWIPLVRRTREPFAGHWALPGGPTEWHETLSDTALRAVSDTVLRKPGYLEQLYAFGAIERSAHAQRLVTIAYWAQYGEQDFAAPPIDTAPEESRGAPADRPGVPLRWDDLPPAPTAGPHPARPGLAQTPDPNVAWFPADRLPPLAFDHAEIVEYALWRLRIKTEYSAVAHRFLSPTFTLAQLRRVHEAILGHAVDPANFRRQSIASGSLIETGKFLTGSAHRPARLYRFRDEPAANSDQPQTTPRIVAE